MANAEAYRYQWHKALVDGARPLGDAEWKELHDQAAKLVHEKHAVLSAFEALSPEVALHVHKPKMVPGDSIALRAEAVLGMEAAYAEAMAQMLSYRDEVHRLGKIFADGYARSIPMDETALRHLEIVAANGSGRENELVLELIKEVRGYRSALRP
jgi:hypothetical protein